MSAADPQHGDLVGRAITVLENMHVTTAPMRPDEMSDIEQRRVTALGYLSQLGTHRTLALIQGIRDRTDHPHALNLLDELEGLVSPR